MEWYSAVTLAGTILEALGRLTEASNSLIALSKIGPGRCSAGVLMVRRTEISGVAFEFTH